MSKTKNRQKRRKTCTKCGELKARVTWYRGPTCASCYERKKANPERKRARKLANEIYYQTPRGRFSNAVCGARYRGIEWALTRTEFDCLLEYPCFYCGNLRLGYGSGLDRLDLSQGYTVTNVIPACGPCNKFKGHYLQHNEMKAIVTILQLLRGKKNIWEGLEFNTYAK